LQEQALAGTFWLKFLGVRDLQISQITFLSLILRRLNGLLRVDFRVPSDAFRSGGQELILNRYYFSKKSYFEGSKAHRLSVRRNKGW